MYFSDDFIEEVLEKNDIVDTISNYIRIEKKGSNYLALCPFHNEKTPSFSISPTKQIFYCFGCHKGGNIIKFVQEYENINFVDAVQNLALKAGLSLPQENKKQNNKDIEKKEKLYEIYKISATYFYHLLNSDKGKNAKNYLLDRGLSIKTIRQFGLGYAGSKNSSLYKLLKSKSFDDEILKESGLFNIKESGASDKFFNRVIFPILDNRNRVIAFGGRVLGNSLPKYLNSPETKLFNKSKTLYALNFARKSRKDYYILCEGYMDVISLHQAGFTNAIAALGTAFNLEHALIINKLVKKVVLSFDSDLAGISATKKTIGILKDVGISTKILDLKPYKDPDEFIKNKGIEEFENRINKAQNSFIWEMLVLQKDYNMQDPESLSNFHKQLAINIAKFSTDIEKENYILFIAKEFMIDINNLRNLVIEVSRSVKIQNEIIENKEKNTHKSRNNKEDIKFTSQAIIINYLLDDNNLINKVKNYISVNDFFEDLYKDFLASIFDIENFNLKKFLAKYSMEEEKSNILAKILNTKINKENKNIELSESIIKIKKLSLERQKNNTNNIQEILKLTREIEDLKKLKINL